MPSETEAIEIATKFVEEKNINCRFSRAAPTNVQHSEWQIDFELILPEGDIMEPGITVVEVDESGNASFFPII
jgi:hypothetical protein